MIRNTFLIVLGFFSLAPQTAFSATFPTTLCADPAALIKEEHIQCLVNELIENYFPELQSALHENRIVFRKLTTPAYYFKTWQISGIFSSQKDKRVYSIRVNPELFAASPNLTLYPSVLAVQGILAHELFHLVDYENAKPGGFIKNQLQELLTNKKYERYTDLRALQLGFAEGLKAYRAWIYTKLKGRDLRNKRKRYYTPEEIDAWLIHACTPCRVVLDK